MKKMTRKKLIRRIFVSFSCVFLFFVLIFCELIMLSNASFRDFFTNERVSVLKDRPEGVTKDIVVDACGVKDSGGIKMLIENLIDGIGEKRPNWQFTVIASKGIIHPLHFKNKNARAIYIDYSASESLLLVRDFLNYISFGLFRDQISQLLFYDTIIFNKQSCNLFFDAYADFIINDFSSIPKISLVHDICYLDSYDNLRRLKSPIALKLARCSMGILTGLREQNAKKIVEFSKKILTVSNFSKKRIMEAYRVDNSFVKTIHIRLANRIAKEESKQFEQQTLDKFLLKTKKYLIYPSVVRPNKNHAGLLRAFIKYEENYPSSDLKLIIVRMIDRTDAETLKQIIEESCKNDNQYRRVKEKIIFTGYVSNKELGVLLSDALAMIFPSLYEGFGMPIIEAMSIGIPIICSNRASLPEVAGNAALLFDPYNIDEMASAINTISTDAKLREILIRRGQERLKYFSDRDSMIDEYIKEFEKYMSN